MIPSTLPPRDTRPSEEERTRVRRPTHGFGGADAPPPPIDSNGARQESIRASGWPDAPTILIVDDEPTISELLADLLGEEGYRVAVAADGVAALAAARRLRPALVLSDWMMPGLSGSDLVRELRRAPATRSIPVVLMSSVRPRDRHLLEVPFLPKPFEIDAVLDLVARYSQTQPRVQLYGEG
jgi:CheY-like chemotaxis protein